MQKLNLPDYKFRIKTEAKGNYIYDSVRRRFVSLTPEEWVRQNFIRYLAEEKKYPLSLMSVERQMLINTKYSASTSLYTINREIPFLWQNLKLPELIFHRPYLTRLLDTIWPLKLRGFWFPTGYNIISVI